MTPNKSESWTVRIPNELAASLREKLPKSGNSEIVLLALKLLLDSDCSSSLDNELTVVRQDITDLKLEIARLAQDLQSVKIRKLRPSDFTQRLNEKEETDGMTRSEFAQHVGVSDETVRRWETGARKPSGKNVKVFDLYRVEDSIWYPI